MAYSEGKQAEMDRPSPVTCDRLPAYPEVPYIVSIHCFFFAHPMYLDLDSYKYEIWYLFKEFIERSIKKKTGTNHRHNQKISLGLCKSNVEQSRHLSTYANII